MTNLPHLPEVASLVRYHDPTASRYLERCLLSLKSQRETTVLPIVLLQRFSDQHEAEVVRLVERCWGSQRGFIVENVHASSLSTEHQDLRSRLLNVGIKIAREHDNVRYLGILDYDDMLAEDAYLLLGERLRRTLAAIAFGKVLVHDVVPFPEYDFVFRTRDVFQGCGKTDLLRDNFCPIHSYLFDLGKIQPEDLHFDERLSRLEDYATLIRIVSKYRSDFECIDQVVGYYYWRTDASNTILTGMELAEEEAEKSKAWRSALELLRQLKEETTVTFWASDF